MTNTRLTRDKAWKFFESTLLLAAIVGIGLWGWATFSRVVYQEWGNWSFDQAGQHAAINKTKPGSPTGSSTPSPPAAPSRRNGPPDSVIGRVVVPRLGVSAIVREGTTDATLRVAAGHITGTAMPGEAGNVAVAAHRDGLFRGLKNVRKGDLVVFEEQSGKHFYKVEYTTIVHPQDVWVLTPKSFPEITLVTCYPFYWIGSAPKRFIVKAREVPDQNQPGQVGNPTVSELH